MPVVNDRVGIRQEVFNVGCSIIHRHAAGHKGVIELLGHIVRRNAVFLHPVSLQVFEMDTNRAMRPSEDAVIYLKIACRWLHVK